MNKLDFIFQQAIDRAVTERGKDNLRVVYAEWLEEQEDVESLQVALSLRRLLRTPVELRCYPWELVFGASLLGQVPERALPNDLDTSVEPIHVWDIKRVVALANGEPDVADWLVVGECYDGRYVSVRAGCDHSGWGCRNLGKVVVAACEEEIIRFGLSAYERERLGLEVSS